ncbi:MAG: thioredoxin family protein [Ekhidna sp.]
MKKYIFVLIALFISITSALAQEWETDFAKAKQVALDENKVIVLVFQGSDWCAPCIRLDREIWSTESFQAYAKSNYVMLQADFPRRKQNALPEALAEANAKLADEYNKNGVFPFVVVMNHKGEVLGETSYKKTTPEAYIKELNSFIK